MLTFNTAPNFEAPTDAGGDNGYDVIVRVTDNGGGADRAARRSGHYRSRSEHQNEAPNTAAVTVTGNEVRKNNVDRRHDHRHQRGLQLVTSFHITNIPNAGTQGTLYSNSTLSDSGYRWRRRRGHRQRCHAVLRSQCQLQYPRRRGHVQRRGNRQPGLTDATPGTETINVTAVNDAPINTGVPASFTVQSGFNHVITGLSISDVDANEVGTPTDITTTFTARRRHGGDRQRKRGGTAPACSGGATITTNGTGTVVLTGSVAQINTTLSGNKPSPTTQPTVLVTPGRHHHAADGHQRSWA